MKVIRAKTAGFCMGVDLALRKLETVLADGAEAAICTLGPIIHNPQVLKDYESQGVHVAAEPSEVPSGARTVIRAHGVPKETENDLVERGVSIVDATCPKVKKAQLLIGKQAQTGAKLILFGERDHPEVKGLLSYAGNDAVLHENPETIKNIEFAEDSVYCLAAQTTQDRAEFKELARCLKEKLGDDRLIVLETICDATKRRQEESIKVADEVEFMVVVGGRNSGNTRRLTQVVEARGTPCIHVESADELPLEKLREYTTIGLTAGASTPKKIIDQVQEVLEGLE